MSEKGGAYRNCAVRHAVRIRGKDLGGRWGRTDIKSDVVGLFRHSHYCCSAGPENMCPGRGLDGAVLHMFHIQRAKRLQIKSVYRQIQRSAV